MGAWWRPYCGGVRQRWDLGRGIGEAAYYRLRMAWFVMVWHGRRTLYEGWQLAYVVAFVAIRVRYGMAVVACGWWTMHRRVVRRDDVCAPVRGAGGG